MMRAHTWFVVAELQKCPHTAQLRPVCLATEMGKWQDWSRAGGPSERVITQFPDGRKMGGTRKPLSRLFAVLLPATSEQKFHFSPDLLFRSGWNTCEIPTLRQAPSRIFPSLWASLVSTLQVCTYLAQRLILTTAVATCTKHTVPAPAN